MQTYMAAEIRETPDALDRFFAGNEAALAEAGRRLKSLSPPVVVTCARGSSDNAAAYFKYLVEILIGVPVASIGPSVASIYGAPLKLGHTLLVSVSQSGQSPDIVALQAAARAAGSYAIAIVNAADSPLARGADAVLPLHAGVERSVAATKTCLVSAAALAALAAEWHGDATLRKAVRNLPHALRAAIEADWSEALPALADARSTYVIGRGPALPIAAEAALKLKETASIHAEAFSGAEVMHGPLQLLQDGFPVIAFRPDDAAAGAMRTSIDRLRTAGGRVFAAETGAAERGRLPIAPTGHPALDPLAMLASFYTLAEQVARARNRDPDRPSLLRKVTETL